MNNGIKQPLFSIALLTSVIIGGSSISWAQTKVENQSSKFLILIETTKEGLKLTAEEGCAWKELSFSLKQDKPQGIDQFGMTSFDKIATQDNKLSSFLFVIRKTKDGVSLEGKNGTAWTNLTFNCPSGQCYQYVDFSGMTAKK